MIHLHQSPHVQQSRLAQPITLDDFVAVFMVAVPEQKQWSMRLLSHSADETAACLTNLGLGIVWDFGRKEVGCVAPLGTGIQTIRIERVNTEFALVTKAGSTPLTVMGDGTDGPITFDLIGGLNDSPGCHVLAAVIMPGRPTPEDVARAVRRARWQLL